MSTNIPGCSPMQHTLEKKDTVSSSGITSIHISPSHRDEATRDVEKYLEENIHGIVDMAAPYEEAYQLAACRVADTISRELDEQLVAAGAVDSKISSPKVASPEAEFEGSAHSGDNYLDQIRLLCAKKPNTSKANLCRYFMSLIRFVACRIQELALTDSDMVDSNVKPRRLVLPTAQMDFKCYDAEEPERIDFGILSAPIDTVVDDCYSANGADTSTRNIAAKSNPGYVDMLLMVEVKQCMSYANLKSARAQLFRYTRNIYQRQHNRRLLWGMVICGTYVQVYKFTPSHASASLSMDITTSGRRRLFIQLLANWSYCEEHILGYDPTISYLDDLQCWEIQVPIEDSGNNGSTAGSKPCVQTFYSNTILVNANRLFGRHTRCFAAVVEKPTVERPITSMTPTVNIKDSWPEAEKALSDGTCYEIRQLRKIRSCLESNAELTNMYPVIEAGGRVHIQHSSHGDWALDFVQCRASKNPDELSQPSPVRVHKRVATSPVGKPLNKLKSVYELIIVMADAMRCHGAIVDECGILHRDISMNNILFTEENGKVKGLLFDFDCAFDLTSPDNIPRTERNGTQPFMSIGNLEGSSVPQTALDDWESVIYILCWYGVFGLNSKTAPDNPVSHPEIHRWIEGDVDQMAMAKRDHLHNSENLNDITKDFCQKMNPRLAEGSLLSKLVHALRYFLIDDHEEKASKGAKMPLPDESGVANMFTDLELFEEINKADHSNVTSESALDPFAARAQRADKIVPKLMTVLGNCSNAVKIYLAKLGS
ncbi:hypothetical protein H4R20_000599 [Coemansia guatemalensis]|uniref:Fungal-type protein kinase domain-containing protein n=1 Tax=Coemansia guatemalensis TaxID=2761395 RepID=A0A9W8I0R7_9FUNG|nr:hypothetical protein H4R20_000599 [Coemansia guatemalensis]